VLQPRPSCFAIKISESICVGCLECVRVCKRKTFVVRPDGKPKVVNRGTCRAGCLACRDVCPTQAIIAFPTGVIMLRQ
jgi:NAD-dependent dihydropyrimidine dehydrogenase PreA subunit